MVVDMLYMFSELRWHFPSLGCTIPARRPSRATWVFASEVKIRRCEAPGRHPICSCFPTKSQITDKQEEVSNNPSPLLKSKLFLINFYAVSNFIIPLFPWKSWDVFGCVRMHDSRGKHCKTVTCVRQSVCTWRSGLSTLHTAAWMMASKPPSGASRFLDTICFFTSSVKRPTSSVSERTCL